MDENGVGTAPEPLSKEQRIAVKLEEYKAITEMHKHFDMMNLTMMSAITGVVLILWGLMFKDADAPSVHPVFMVFLATAVLFVLSAWIRYVSIHRGIITLKLTRACSIEDELGMEQNRIFRYTSSVRLLRRRPGAHLVEILVYWFLVTLGAAVMVYGCISPEITFDCCLAQLWAAAWNKRFPVFFFFGHLLFSVYWGIRCRVHVAELIPHYATTRRSCGDKIVYWLFVLTGGFKGLPEECPLADEEPKPN